MHCVRKDGRFRRFRGFQGAERHRATPIISLLDDLWYVL